MTLTNGKVSLVSIVRLTAIVCFFRGRRFVAEINFPKIGILYKKICYIFVCPNIYKREQLLILMNWILRMKAFLSIDKQSHQQLHFTSALLYGNEKHHASFHCHDNRTSSPHVIEDGFLTYTIGYICSYHMTATLPSEQSLPSEDLSIFHVRMKQIFAIIRNSIAFFFWIVLI